MIIIKYGYPLELLRVNSNLCDLRACASNKELDVTLFCSFYTDLAFALPTVIRKHGIYVYTPNGAKILDKMCRGHRLDGPIAS